MNNLDSTFDKLFKWVNSGATSIDDEPWFYEELNKLINNYGKDVAIQYAQSEKWPEYTFELMVKSGLREIPKEILLPYLKTDNEDNMYCAAFALAACGYDEGFDVLKAFANKTHPLIKNTHPALDILPDLSFITDSRVNEIKILCQKYL